jgi:hypothetical protein
MSFEDCINNNDKIASSDKKEMIKRYNAYKKPFITRYGSAQGELLAIDSFTKSQAELVAKSREAKASTVLSWYNIHKELKESDEKFTKLKAGGGISKKLYSGSQKVRAAGTFLETKVNNHAQQIESMSFTSIGEFLEKYRAKWAGITQDVEGVVDIAKSVVNQDFGGENGYMAKAINNLFTTLAERYERAGGTIGRLEGYMPQRWVADRVRAFKDDEFYKDFSTRLDFQKMGWADDTGTLTVDAEKILRKTYKKIVTGNVEEISQLLEQGKIPRNGLNEINARYRNERVFYFKTADDYIEMNRKYGVGDEGIFESIMGHVHTMSRDIAILEALGANPDDNIRRILAFAATDNPTISEHTRLENMWKVMAGRTSFGGEVSTAYKFYEALSTWQRVTKLGGAAVSAVGDVVSVANTAKLNGIPPMQAVSAWANHLNPASIEDRHFARTQVHIAQATQGILYRGTKFEDDAMRAGKLQWMSQFVHTAGGLAHITDAGQTAITLSTQAFFAGAKRAKMAFDDLPDAMLEAFKRHGIDEVDYNNILKAIPLDHNGAQYLRPEDVWKVNEKAANKYGAWQAAMRSQATNESPLFMRAVATGGNKRGTTARAVSGTIMMFKSFGFSMTYHHLLPMLRNAAAGNKGAGAHLTGFIGASLVAGAFIQQAQQIINGKTPRDMNDPRFYAQALATSGGMGIFGNFLFADYTQLGNTFQSTLLGANAGFLESAAELTIGAAAKALDPNREVKIGDPLAKFVRSNVPTLWWNRLLVERLILDNTERFINPQYDNRIRRVEKKMKKDFNQEYWLPPTK